MSENWCLSILEDTKYAKDDKQWEWKPAAGWLGCKSGKVNHFESQVSTFQNFLQIIFVPEKLN